MQCLKAAQGNNHISSWREKGRYLTQFYDKSPYTYWKIQKATVTRQHKNATKTHDYTTIPDRLGTVSWSYDSDPICVENHGTCPHHYMTCVHVISHSTRATLLSTNYLIHAILYINNICHPVSCKHFQSIGFRLKLLPFHKMSVAKA